MFLRKGKKREREREQSWTNPLTSLNLTFLTCKLGIKYPSCRSANVQMK